MGDDLAAVVFAVVQLNSDQTARFKLMPKEFVEYRGVRMIEGWPERIQEAQKEIVLTLAGRSVPRIAFGDEKDDWGANEHPCADCRVFKGELHVPGCDGEECPVCHEQLITCDCAFDSE